MPEHPESTRALPKPQRTLFERLAAFVSPEPESRDELLSVLHDAHSRKLIDAECLSMIEGVFEVNELAARDLMIPRTQIDAIDITRPIDEWLPEVIESGHSRFPAITGELDNVAGIILTKDLLAYFIEKEFNLQSIIRPAVFIPESKRANVLLRDFRVNRNHMALVVDEYGSIAGLITIEDVLEEIVGEIEDEYDDDDDEAEIRLIKTGENPAWRVSALIELANFNQAANTTLNEDSAETLGGYIANELGSIPHTGDVFDIDNLHFVVLKADASQIHYLMVEKRAATSIKAEFTPS
jgi:magnesium and cobalt transporter